VVDVDVGLVQEVPHDLDMTAFGRGDEGDAAIAVRDRRVGFALVRHLEDVEQSLPTRVQHRIVERGVLRVDIGPRVEQVAEGSSMPAAAREHRGG
jgi:hypothetical protein